ncbi:Protein transport protein sec24c [Fasciola gigantica]|uniref:Protein transport protein sec24c n=1 Tax=Fasciola gigantica TaxID=46835 RepID=A0A504ZB22_FASGI|nr:Protein transport protein sec24c [Fasciola gigantica]
MHVRTSAGTCPVEFFGNCPVPNTTDIELACVDPDSAITVHKLQDNDLGQRRLRIHNLSLSTTSSIPEIFRIAELDTHMNWLGKFAMHDLCSRAHQHLVDEMTSKAAYTLAAYRRHCSGGPSDVGASPGERVPPRNMKLFPMYIQCLMKTDAFMPTDQVSIDERARLMFLLNEMDVEQSNALFYPRLYPVHNLAPKFEGNVYPPPAIRCSYEYMQPDGAYLLENGLNLLQCSTTRALCSRPLEPKRPGAQCDQKLAVATTPRGVSDARG